ncbi:MAG TPA: hypothetical protein VFY83_10655, partial [Anaerolineales bacterium]|nr:hypothetical protein [Anaerolineales bacterium]
KQELANTLFIDLSARTGPVKHGASGFLYGLGKAEIPSVNTLAPLKAQVAAQKPEAGLQHPNGDALNVSDTYKAAGGREIEIYIQDIYPNWPYDSAGIDDYLGKVEQIVSQVIASPNRSLFSYVPFNEPDQIWYNKTDKKQVFFEDWQTVYRKIKTMNALARVVGPNLANYDSAFYRDFMAFANENGCLPDVVSWHELNDDFFGGWYQRFDDFRSIECDLGLPTREICINEYCRIKGDLGIPGQLIQWITRFENSKVDACLAYWTDAGSLNNLVTRDHYNQATGAWWLYRWYGGLTGDTVKVTPPAANAEGLQGLAALDSTKKQARILLGGCNGDVNVVVKTTPYFNEVHAVVWVAEHTGLNAAADPALILEGDFEITSGQLKLVLESTVSTAAYQIILSPHRTAAPARPRTYLAEYADLSGNTTINYMDIAHVDSRSGGTITFIVTAPGNGFYTLKVTLTNESAAGAFTSESLQLILNGFPLTDVSLPKLVNPGLNVFLTVGINQIAFKTITDVAIPLLGLEIASGTGVVDVYEAESVQNTLGGTAVVIDDPTASGGKYVGGIGNGAANFLEFNNVKVPQSGLYRMVVHFANAEFRGGHSYNSQVVDLAADIRVNHDSTQRVYFRNTFDWENYQTRVVNVMLQAGRNTIRFSNDDPHEYAPRIDKTEIAAPYSI